jgi:alkanesulfonate monooxygenase SsuD/methylene tetrahydromethanopterin reductase-like flavin-dependent oxidoreductase (luciferase family)
MRGVERAGRVRSDVELMCPVFVVTGDSDDELTAAAAATRKQIAFYGSTPAYRKVLDLHGWGNLQDELHGLSKQGDWDTMGTLIDDDVLEAFAVVAPVDELGDALKRRCAGSIDRVMVGLPTAVAEARVAALLTELRTAG